MRDYRLIDADCHVVEPPHIWEQWLPKKFRDRAPKLVKDDEGGDAWQLQPDAPPMYIGLVATPGMRYEDIKWKGYTYETVRKGCFDGKARLEDMRLDGVDAEFLYPSQRTMYYFMGNEDRDFHRAGVRAYNDFMAQEFCAADPERLFFLAQMPNLGVEEGLAELERCKEMGARGAIITTWPAGGDDLVREDEAFFAAAAEMRMPVSIHINIQRKRNPRPKLEGPAAIASMAMAGMLMFPPIMAELIMSGLFDRVPGLQIVGVETEVGWIPEALEQLDNFYWRNRAHTGVEIERLPSEYFRNHFTCTFIRDKVGVNNRYDIGVRNMAWSSDYPHHGCDWPYSRKVVAEMFDRVPVEERHAICAGNMVRLYGLPQAA
ncbi:MAG: amidohydrolase family protein [Deltaproteobacteria bacterium]|nr:MAG: amidohydrolase family protein [Deltaproteobacteria bacterium]